MKLRGLTLETQHFQEYLSFLTEVLDLEVTEMKDDSMKFDLEGTWLEIKSTAFSPLMISGILEFFLPVSEYQELYHKVDFYSYRKLSGLFKILSHTPIACVLSDPDGRSWRISCS